MFYSYDMRKTRVISLLFFFVSLNGFSCSSFCLKTHGQVIMGKSYDWSTNSGVLLTNLRGPRVSMPVGNVPTFTWLAKYGSITFNQYGQFLPNGGMNEAGLAIEVLWLDDTEYPTLDVQKPLNELQWVQYMLDNCSNVEEVVTAANTLCIVPLFAKLHYFIADSTGNAAVVEFINGKMEVHFGSHLQCNAITNDPYSSSFEYFTHGSSLTTGGYNASLNRFSRLAKELGLEESTRMGVTPADIGFGILNKVWVKNWTKWNIVYNLTNRTISFKSDISLPIKTVTMSSFNFEANGRVLFSNVNSFYAGKIEEHFELLTPSINEQIMRAGVMQVGIPISTIFVHLLASYPSQETELSKEINQRCDTLGTLIIEVKNLKFNGGLMSIGLFNSEQGFKSLKPINGGKVGVHNGVAKLVIYNLPLNHEYAVSYYHDENGNGKLDMNRLGIPVEPYGFSGSGARKYSKAKFLLNSPIKNIVIVE
jgi:Penicillin V acylase and related amidases